MREKPKSYRFLEIMPGALVWATFALALILSFTRPIILIYYIIILDLYWLFRVIYFSIHLIASWRRYKENLEIDWFSKILREPKFNDIYHLILLPTYKEDLSILRTSFNKLLETEYPKDKFIVVLAGEERDLEHFNKISAEIAREFGDKFYKFFITVHPACVLNEIAGKGSNMNYAGHQAKSLIDILGIKYENIIVSMFDIDTVVHKKYFAKLTNVYLTHPNPTHSSYQPVAIFANNIWESPSVVRIAAFGTTFWLMTELSRPEKLLTFSSHSMSFKALVDVGFHDKSVVSEDSRIFLQCFMRYNGDYEVTPLFIPVFMNTVRTESYLRSLINLYKQQRRWAYGVENIPFMLWNFARSKTIPFGKKFRHAWNLIEGMYSWATVPILIFVLGYLPLYVAGGEVKAQAIVANTPFTLETIMTLAMSGVLLSAILSMILLPPRPPEIKLYTILIMILQWALLPVTFVIFGSFAAIDAQTRLMLGKYLGFWVTEKK